MVKAMSTPTATARESCVATNARPEGYWVNLQQQPQQQQQEGGLKRSHSLPAGGLAVPVLAPGGYDARASPRSRTAHQVSPRRYISACLDLRPFSFCWWTESASDVGRRPRRFRS